MYKLASVYTLPENRALLESLKGGIEMTERTPTTEEKGKVSAQPATAPAKKKRSKKETILNFLMYGWIFILMLIIGMIILISSLVSRC